VFGLSSSLLPLAFSFVAWPSGLGVSLGFVLGAVLAFVLIDRTLRRQAITPPPGWARRLASLCCLVWGLILPLTLAVAGLLWGLGFGIGKLVEGPLATTVSQTTHVWLSSASGLGATVLKRLPLAKRMTERELLTVVQAAPEWIAEALDQNKLDDVWQKATGAPLPAQLSSVMRHQFRALTEHHGEWLHPVVERLREQAQATTGSGPTVQEAIEATVAPAVFHQASLTIRKTTRRDAGLLALAALGLSALLTMVLRLARRQTAPRLPRVSVDPSSAHVSTDSAGG